jgi:replicative DNA helicase
MTHLFEKSEPIDLVTVSNALRTQDKLELVGGTPYLSDLVQSTPTSAHVYHHACIVEEKSTLRSLITAGSDIVGSAFDEDRPVTEILDSAENHILKIAQDRFKKAFTHVKDVLMPVMDRIESMYETKNQLLGVSSGFPDLDNYTSGFQKSDLIILAARPSMGKTALALNFAQHASLRHQVPVAIFSMEMTKEQIVQRLLCSEAKIDNSRLRLGQLHDNEYKRLAKTMSRLSEAPIYIDDTAGMTPTELKAKARRLQREFGLGMIMVDFLQLMHTSDRSKKDNRVQEIAEISRSLKTIAKELNIPVIALSQLSRNIEVRTNKRR